MAVSRESTQRNISRGRVITQGDKREMERIVSEYEQYCLRQKEKPEKKRRWFLKPK